MAMVSACDGPGLLDEAKIAETDWVAGAAILALPKIAAEEARSPVDTKPPMSLSFIIVFLLVHFLCV
jgi:hypothetical protein